MAINTSSWSRRSLRRRSRPHAPRQDDPDDVDNAIILLRDPVSEIAEELRIVFCRLSLEELTRVWEALREPYRLSICYEVRVTRVDSLRTQQHARVVERGVARPPVPVAAERSNDGPPRARRSQPRPSS